MNVDMKMAQVVREVQEGADTDPEYDKAERVRRAIQKWRLDGAEVRYLCRCFGVLTEDVQ